MVKLERHILPLLLGLLWSFVPAAVRAERLPVRLYTSADGLGSNFVNSLMRDSRGFLWFCTRDGLSRFDGSRFVTYQVGDKNSPPGIEQIYETRQGIYWITTTGGLYRFDPNATPAQPSPNTDRPMINAQLVTSERGVFFEDHAGTLWSGGRSLSRLEERDGKVFPHEVELGLPLDPSAEFIIRDIIEGRDESLWLVTSQGLVRRLPDGREIFYRVGTRTDSLTSMLEDGAGRIWIGRASGIHILMPEPLAELGQLGAVTLRRLDDITELRSPEKASLPEKAGEIFKYAEVKGFSDAPAKYLYRTGDGHVWISGGDGIVEFDGQRFIPYTTAQGLLKGYGRMVEDNGGNLWLGWATGLMRLDRHGLTSYDVGDGLKNSSIQTIGESQDGKLYVGAADFFLSQFDGKGFQTIRPQLPPDARASWTSNPAFQDRAGEWWFLTNERLYRFAASSDLKALAGRRPLAIYEGGGNDLKGHEIFHIFEDSKGDLWISTRDLSAGHNSLSRWNRGTEKFQSFSEAEGFVPGKAVSSFAEDRQGRLWFGLYEGGLLRYEQGRFTELTTADGLPDGLITALHLDRQGRLWIASSLGGLSRIDDTGAAHPRFQPYTTHNGLSSNNVRSLTEDMFGNIYAGTARGVDRLSPDAARIRHYSIKDGLAGDFVNAAFRDRSGALWFGTPNGLSRLMPEAETGALAPTVWLGGLRVAGEKRAVPELGGAEIAELELAHTQNNLQVDFFGVDFSAGSSLRYQFMLEGADRDWSQPTEQGTVTYANLAPGSYRFLVRAINAYGMVSARPASFSLHILPPVWRRWWFLSLLALAVALTALALDRYRVNRMKELDAALKESKQLTEELTAQRSELSRANRALELDYEVTSILAESESRGDAAPRILQAICQRTGWQVGAIWRVDARSNVLHCVSVWHQPAVNARTFEALTRESIFAPGKGLPGRVWSGRSPLWLTDLAADTNFPRLAAARAEGLRSAFGFPVSLEGEVIGVLEFFSLERREQDRELVEMMTTIGGHIGQLIERKRAEEDLRESEDRMRTLAETAADAIITIDEKSTIVFVNPAARRVFGYEVAELLGADLTMLMPEYLRHLHRAGLNRYAAAGEKHISWEGIELPGLKKDGQEIPLEISFGEFSRNGRRFFTGIARDITERKRAEEAIRRAREERLRELERVRRRIATDLHDDIGSSLTQISILSEVVSQQVGRNDSPMTKPLSLIANTSRELVDSMSDIVWAINPQKDHLSDLTQRMRRFASDVFTARNVEFSFRAPQKEEDVQLGANVRRELFLIFKESVNNMVKHSGCTEAQIEFQINGESLSLTVSDNGMGFDTGLESEGHGLVSMRERTEGLGGTLEMISEAGKGTTLMLRIPLGQPQMFPTG